MFKYQEAILSIRIMEDGPGVTKEVSASDHILRICMLFPVTAPIVDSDKMDKGTLALTRCKRVIVKVTP